MEEPLLGEAPFTYMEFDDGGKDPNSFSLLQSLLPVANTSPLSSSEYAAFELEEPLREPPIPYTMEDDALPYASSRLYADEEELPDALAPTGELHLPDLFQDMPEVFAREKQTQQPMAPPAIRTAPLAPIPRAKRFASALPSPPSSPRRKGAPKWIPAPLPEWRQEPEATFIFEPFPDQFSCPLRILRAQLWSYVPRVRGQRWLKLPQILRALHLVLILGMLSPGIRRTTVCCILPFLTAIHIPHWGWLLGRLAAAMSLIKYCDTHGMHDEGSRSPTQAELDEFKLKMATPAVQRRIYAGLARHLSGLPTTPSRHPCIVYFNSPAQNPFAGNLVTYGLLYNGFSAADFDDQLTDALIAPNMASSEPFADDEDSD